MPAKNHLSKQQREQLLRGLKEKDNAYVREKILTKMGCSFISIHLWTLPPKLRGSVPYSPLSWINPQPPIWFLPKTMGLQSIMLH
ncbi:hypothetical protein NIES932_04250 [Raphidiopsis curvata NIES-932]|nr:hypothetical protein NIES932_04250 [Raphidiopsis curvata NIES-932]